MSTTSQSINHSFLFEEDHDQNPTQMGFVPFPPNNPLLGCHQSVKSMGAILSPSSLSSEAASSNASFAETLLSTNALQIPRQQDLSSTFGEAQQLLSLNRSRVNSWAWGEVSDCLMGRRIGGDNENNHLGVSAIKMKRMKGRRKVREPRFCFKTMSDVDVLDDGYKWRKYGQKVVKNTQHPRSYYRCTQDNCRVKKRVERLAEDPRMVITTYEGRHVHSPSNELEDSQNPSELSDFLW